jgi:hypothetical protein
MPAPPTITAYISGDFTAARNLLGHGESEALALQLLVAKRARQRDLQRAVATKAAAMLAELGNQARAADLDLLVTLVELAATEAERERGRWGDATN